MVGVPEPNHDLNLAVSIVHIRYKLMLKIYGTGNFTAPTVSQFLTDTGEVYKQLQEIRKKYNIPPYTI